MMQVFSSYDEYIDDVLMPLMEQKSQGFDAQAVSGQALTWDDEGNLVEKDGMDLERLIEKYVL